MKQTRNRAAALCLALLSAVGCRVAPPADTRQPAHRIEVEPVPETPPLPLAVLPAPPAPPAAQRGTDAAPPSAVPPAASPLASSAVDVASLLREATRDPEAAYRALQAIPADPNRSPRAVLFHDALRMALLNALGDAAAAHALAADVERRLRAAAPLEIANLCLTTGVDAGYGNPERLPADRAEAGVKAGDAVNLYYEVDRLEMTAVGDGTFACRFDADIRLETSDGAPVWEFEQWEKQFNLRNRRHASRRPITDFYFHYKGLAIPRRTAPGRYRLVIEFSDLGGAAPRVATAHVDIKVIP